MVCWSLSSTESLGGKKSENGQLVLMDFRNLFFFFFFSEIRQKMKEHTHLLDTLAHTLVLLALEGNKTFTLA